MRRQGLSLVLAAACLAAGAAHAAGGSTAGVAEPSWGSLQRISGIIDLAGPRRDGRFMVAEAGGLSLLEPGQAPQPFARGPNGYVPATTGEAYIALGPRHRMPNTSCPFEPGTVFALDPTTPAVVRISRSGIATRLAELPSDTFPSGIAFDRLGGFGHALLVTARANKRVDLYGINCRGEVKTFVRDAPQVEGGMGVAPRTFGRFGGRLIAVDEFSGRIYALGAKGRVRLVANSGLAFGEDIGVESIGFVPRLRRLGFAMLSDHGFGIVGGSDNLLALGRPDLRTAGVRPGDLLVATETGAETIRVRCAATCSVRKFATGPDATHAEGHIVFALRP